MQPTAEDNLLSVIFILILFKENFHCGLLNYPPNDLHLVSSTY